MAAITHGEEFVYGIDQTILGTAIQVDDREESPVNVTTVENESGNRISERSDDMEKTLKLEFKTKASYTIPAAKTVITYDSVTYKIDKVSNSRSNKTHRMCTLECSKPEYITPA